MAVASKTPINDENPCRSRIERTAFFCRGENLTERPQPASASRGVFMTVPTIPRERISSKNFTVCSRLRKAININFSISTSIFMYPIWSAYMPFDVLYSRFENRVTFASHAGQEYCKPWSVGVFLTNTASDSQATKPPIFSMIFVKNERSCTLSVLQASFCQKARKLRRFDKACIILARHLHINK